MSRVFEYFAKYIYYSIQSGILWFLRLTTLDLQLQAKYNNIEFREGDIQ